MCGIAGIVSNQFFSYENQSDFVKLMTDQITFRGPDSSGIWTDHKHVCFGHRRLSIVDLNTSGDQPMVSRSGRYTLVLNGEIYNHNQLRSILINEIFTNTYIWRGFSDTEVLLNLIDAFGINKALEMSVGMFSLAIWDSQENNLTLARDRLGEKPLYYYFNKNKNGFSLIFASDISCIEIHPQFRSKISLKAVNDFVSLGYISREETIYQDVKKLLPGYLLTLSANTSQAIPQTLQYWSYKKIAHSGIRSRKKETNFSNSVTELRNLLGNVISNQSSCDVPIGAFLSGGIDSTAVVAIMQQQSNKSINTFTVGFNETSFDESIFAKRIASYLKTEHHELRITSQDAFDIIPLLPKIYTEPFADVSQIPTYLISKFASKHVKVALTGDGGDEIFGGYDRYFAVESLWRIHSMFPQVTREIISKLLRKIPPTLARKLPELIIKNIMGSTRENIPHRIQKLANLIISKDITELHMNIVSHWEPSCLVLNRENSKFNSIDNEIATDDIREMLMIWDALHYLPDDICVKVDRAAMFNSLETRAPLLDHRIVEFAWSLPSKFKFYNGQGKHILREIISEMIPRSMFERPKMGFGVPIGEWLRDPLKDWAESLLSPELIKDQGIFNVGIIRKRWEEHLTRKKNWEYALWDVLIFQQWINSRQGLKI